MIRAILSGVEVAVNIMQLDGIVLARSLFHSSMNYQSVSLYGRGKEVTEVPEKLRALEVISESIWKGRWEEARQPEDGELAATAVIEIPITEGAAKIRTGPANDNEEDKKLNIWAGVVPVLRSFGVPEANPDLDDKIKLPPSLS